MDPTLPFNSDDFVLIDCGSTTTKALYFRKQDQWSLRGVVNTPTTVEEPVSDVTIGVYHALEQVQQRSEGLFQSVQKTPLIATSSAGGGLQIAVIGLTKEISTAASNQAALNAGAIVSLVGSADDEAPFNVRVKQLQSARPDIVIIAGGLDTAKPLAMSDTLAVVKEAKLRPRYGVENSLPVIFCGSVLYIDEVRQQFEGLYDVMHVSNLIPAIEYVDDTNVKESIQELFLESVMNHAPGYSKLLQMVSLPILPTPMAVTKIVQSIAQHEHLSVLAVDIGGATTDIYTVTSESAQRSVSANFGMSYSAASVLQKAGLPRIAQYCTPKIPLTEIETYIWNKTLFPTKVPDDAQSIEIEQSLCRAALQLSYAAHLEVCKDTLPPGQLFDLCIASGGVLSHAPDMKEVPWIMADGFNLLGVTRVAVDKIFMMPHLGALSEVAPQLSIELLYRECLIPLCWMVGLQSKKAIKHGAIAAKLLLDNKHLTDVIAGQRSIIEVGIEEGQTITIVPSSRLINCGQGAGITFHYTFKSSSTLPLYLDGMRCV